MAQPAAAAPANLAPRHLGAVNWLGLWTLYQKEVRRFLKVTGQTVVGPLVMSLLFLAIFAVALGSRRGEVGGVAYVVFLAPGLIIMSVAQNAFANAASSLLIAKTQGTIVDLLLAPLRPVELVLAFTLSAVTRGLLVGLVIAGAMAPFVPMAVAQAGPAAVPRRGWRLAFGAAGHSAPEPGLSYDRRLPPGLHRPKYHRPGRRRPPVRHGHHARRRPRRFLALSRRRRPRLAAETLRFNCSTKQGHNTLE